MITCTINFELSNEEEGAKAEVVDVERGRAPLMYQLARRSGLPRGSRRRLLMQDNVSAHRTQRCRVSSCHSAYSILASSAGPARPTRGHCVQFAGMAILLERKLLRNLYYAVERLSTFSEESTSRSWWRLDSDPIARAPARYHWLLALEVLDLVQNVSWLNVCGHVLLDSFRLRRSYSPSLRTLFVSCDRYARGLFLGMGALDLMLAGPMSTSRWVWTSLHLEDMRIWSFLGKSPSNSAAFSWHNRSSVLLISCQKPDVIVCSRSEFKSLPCKDDQLSTSEVWENLSFIAHWMSENDWTVGFLQWSL